MGTGELTRRVEVDNAEHGLGAVVTHTGRVSVARRLVHQEPALPFTPSQLDRLDEALTLAGRSTGLDFSVYLGALGEDSRATAEDLHASMGSAARDALLIAVSPAGRVVEVVTGSEAARRVPNRGCKLAVMSMVASFKEGDLVGGLLSGLRMLSDQAGNQP